ncbi:ISP domain-containing protein [Sistotremastrum suecicum HHB10207 ss-3]|nr:ISP domain-containing protein [Sistotremastrum suecicum HHB10207 ss-3]
METALTWLTGTQQNSSSSAPASVRLFGGLNRWTDSFTKGPKSTQSSLSSFWNRSEEVYELERRAIFSKVWLLVCHKARLQNIGDYASFEIAGFPFFLVKDKEGNINAFHNVCRHRAFPIVTKESGNAPILGCRYHGWSYSHSGSLIKAPKFDEVPAFDKSTQSLFPIHVHVNEHGFVFVNFDAAETPISYEEHFRGIETQWISFNESEYNYLWSWSLEGDFHWSTFMDGYQECYHCRVAHPGFAQTLELETYTVSPGSNFASHQVQQKGSAEPKEDGAEKTGTESPSFTFVFPNGGVTITSGIWYMMRCVPVGAHKTRLEYDVYGRKDVPEERIREAYKFFEQVEREDWDLCQKTQKNLNVGIYDRGFLHPQRENGVLYYQSLIRDMVMEHFEAELEKGEKIFPAHPK